ncbi:MAG: hypothetical protein IKS09_05495, partial [Lachnospiraceae bacterium]|nr:hypothetical protein [Lachnospiraceae bacterium]
MRRLKRYLPALLAIALVCGILGYMKVKADEIYFSVSHTDLCDDGTAAYGADIIFTKLHGEDGSETGEVKASIQKFYTGENITVPATVSAGGVTYSVVSLDLNGEGYSGVNFEDMNGTITVPE